MVWYYRECVLCQVYGVVGRSKQVVCVRQKYADYMIYVYYVLERTRHLFWQVK